MSVLKKTLILPIDDPTVDGYVPTWSQSDGYWISKSINTIPVTIHAAISGSYQILSIDYEIPVDTTSSSTTITLPDGVPVGASFSITDVGGNAAVNNITIIHSAGTGIMGAVNNDLVINTNYSNATLRLTTSTLWSLV